ncbi:MAG: thermonuclease family protein [Nitrosopumilaceae archaeon]
MNEPKCYRCGKPISFDSKIKSKTGKFIPLDPNTNTPHNCSELAFDSNIPSKPKQTIKKGVPIAIASVLVIIIVIAGIGFLTNSDNIQNKNNIPISNYNSDNAQYFTGKVTGIIDGDTIKVDGKSVRLALASTPELNQPMGQAAKKYIQEICPIGSTVTVDEDNGQTQGSYGRIVAKVTCNGVNLNQAIIEKLIFNDRNIL